MDLRDFGDTIKVGELNFAGNFEKNLEEAC